MKITPKNIKKFQVGGAMEAPVEEQQGAEQDPMMQLAEMAAQALEGQDCQAAMQVCQVVVWMIQQAGQQEPQGEPVYRRGGILVRRIKN